jgi:GNAT superfamily N-acetyltransferase
MDVQIRVVGPTDRRLALELLTAQLVEHHLPADPDQIARGLDAAFRPHSPAWLYVAERDGKPVGILLANKIVSVEKGGETLWFEELYVVPEARRTGVARALFQHICAEARRRGIRAFDLEVVPTQEPAFALYANLGFSKVNRQRLTFDL